MRMGPWRTGPGPRWMTRLALVALLGTGSATALASTTSASAAGAAGAAATTQWTASQAVLPIGPLPDGGTPVSIEITATSCTSSFCMAVGNVGDNRAGFPLAEVYESGQWTPSVLPLPSSASGQVIGGRLTAVSCAADGSCGAAGVDILASGATYALLEHLSAGKWTATTGPLPPGHPFGAVLAMNAVSCSDSAQCVAVGDTNGFSGGDAGVIYTFNGSTWRYQRAPSFGFDGVTQLNGVSCLASRCVAVGDYLDLSSHSHALILSGQGTFWSMQHVPALPESGTAAWLNTVDCPAQNACVAVGGLIGGKVVGEQGLTLYQQGGTWRGLVNGTALTLTNELNGVSCPTVGTCIATQISYGPESGAVLNGSNASWSDQATPWAPGGVSCGTIDFCMIPLQPEFSLDGQVEVGGLSG